MVAIERRGEKDREGAEVKIRFDEVADQRGEANKEGRKYIWWLKRLIRED